MLRNTLKLLAVVWLGVLASVALAQPYPGKPIHLLVGYPPGSAVDFIARLIGPKMAEGLGQPIIVDNRPGASGIVAATAAAKSPPDGYTLLVTVPGSITTARAIMKDRLQYSPETDLVPIGLVGVSPLLLLVTANSGIKSVGDFVGLAKKTSGGLNIASYGVGSPSHFALEMFKSNSKLPVTHVPHNGSAAAMNALLGGVVHASFDSVTTSMPLISAGRVVPLAITASSRVPALSHVPTMAEAGMGAIEVGGWAGLHAPKGTPATIVQRINSEMNRVLALPEIRKGMGDRLVLVGGAPSVFEAHIQAERARLTRIIDEAGLTFE